ncbi:hypothetical protein B296_00004190 [Ensete ventricosum]|uniref:Uncharacterized protein n=1 Tax=Ensete ventricosum TaxID=4639 RepID=A0A426YZA1_ENSVE|nr:hypothetical protein B296_00004190 [Ensete ventricosum]
MLATDPCLLVLDWCQESGRRTTLVRSSEAVRSPSDPEEGVWEFVRIDRDEAGKLRRGRLGLLGNAPSALPSRGLPRDLARSPRQGGGARRGPSDDQISIPTEMILRDQYRESSFVLLSGGVFIVAKHPISHTPAFIVADLLSKANVIVCPSAHILVYPVGVEYGRIRHSSFMSVPARLLLSW